MIRNFALLTILLAACSGANSGGKDDLGAPLPDLAGAPPLDFSTVDGAAPPMMLVINEVAPHGADPLTDPDFAELKNLGANAIDLSGYTVADSKTTATLPNGTSVAPGAYLVILCDDAPDGGASDALHVGFKLSGSGDEFHLKKPDGSAVDDITWGATTIPKPMSYCRVPDGTGSFLVCTPTKGASNMQ